MVRSDSFFIRAEVALDNAGTFATTSIDLGSFVDALGKTVLRVHNAAVQYTYGAASPQAPIITLGNNEAITSWQLTTQNQTAMVNASNRTVISTGALAASNSSAVGNTVTFFSQDIDIAPQHWTNGFLLAVESIQLAGLNSNEMALGCVISLVLECTVETMTSAAAMALALSQQ